ncbi:hypothetical protein PtA15_3A861 [Puccinia triticina]|uniref:Uncharacterized protein n=1 Tax=Puccinia triticina TaxID=208348 RepID=A0ABY7CFE7_9BASI|nr:uncharacterized protein PtA15_3A861 [Puccinia triticina]WAQ83490.1 hypothetical protein PtA15_3A861 [Puccinia triticina]
MSPAPISCLLVFCILLLHFSIVSTSCSASSDDSSNIGFADCLTPVSLFFRTSFHLICTSWMYFSQQ